MIPSAYYRSRLTPQEQKIYQTVVNSLLCHQRWVPLIGPLPDHEALRRIVQAVHLDHPEIFWVNFWKVQTARNIADIWGVLHFEEYLDKEHARCVLNTMKNTCRSLETPMEKARTQEEKYRVLMEFIAQSTSYLNSGSAFWDHTAAGAILKHKAVCEGVSKLFLYLCQYYCLSCALVQGTVGGEEHLWNMIELHKEIRFMDITLAMNTWQKHGKYPSRLVFTRGQLLQRGYVWRCE